MASLATTTLLYGVSTTRVGFGCASIMRVPSRSDRQYLLATAFDGGIRHYDVARMYGLGAAESEVGRFARGHRRDEFVIASKFGLGPGYSSRSKMIAQVQAPIRRVMARYPKLRRSVKRYAASRDDRRDYGPDEARHSLQTSLRQLGTDYVDLFLLHEPQAVTGDRLSDTCAYLEHARTAGHIRAWGVSGDPEACRAIQQTLASPIVLQTSYDIISDVAKGEGVEDTPADIVFGYFSGVLQVIVTHVRQSPDIRRRWSNAIGVDCGSTDVMAALLLRDALSRCGTGCVLFGSTSADHVRDLAHAAAHDDSHVEPVAALRRMIGQELVSPAADSC